MRRVVGSRRKKRNLIVNRQLEMNILLMGPIVIAIILLLPIAIPLLYNSQFLGVLGMTQIAAAGLLWKAFYLPLEYIPLSRGEARIFLVRGMLFRIIAHRLRNHRLPVVWSGWFGGRYCCCLCPGVDRSLCFLSCSLCLSVEFPGRRSIWWFIF